MTPVIAMRLTLRYTCLSTRTPRIPSFLRHVTLRNWRISFFFLMIRPPPRSPLFPYTTLFRSEPRPMTRISEQTAGWMHFFIFWGFTVLGIQVVQMFVRGFVPEFYLFPFTPHLLGGP